MRILIVLIVILVTATAVADPVTVQTEPLASLLQQPELSAPATVISRDDSRIGAELAAVLREIPVQVGDVVAAGGVLARLDCGDTELTLQALDARRAALEARLGFAQKQLDRARSLQKQRTMAQESLDERNAALAELSAQREELSAERGRAVRNLDRCAVRAPFRAVVLERLAGEGEYAMPGTPLLRVLALDRLEVSADVLVEEAEALSRTGLALFRHAGVDYPLRLRVLVPAIDAQSRTRQARFEFTTAAALPGAAGRLVWPGQALLPADFLVRRQGQLGVLYVDGAAARFHPLPEAREGRPAVVNLPADTAIVTEGRYTLDVDQAVVVSD